MSTRCQIEFKHVSNYLKKKKSLIERRTVYRHSDGYPDGVIPDLKKFLKWNGGRNSDIEYQTANFIYWSKRWHEELYFNKDWGGTIKKIADKNLKWSDNNPTNVSTLHTGFGICENDGFHGDIEYFYEVVREVTELEKHKWKTETKILVYEIIQKDYSKPIKRENLKLIKTVKIKPQEMEQGQVISQPSI